MRASPSVLSTDGKGGVTPTDWTGSFSAVCYLFGRALKQQQQRQQLKRQTRWQSRDDGNDFGGNIAGDSGIGSGIGSVPIGLVASYIGGTPVECWSSDEALTQCPSTMHSKAHMDWGDCYYSMITPLLRMPIKGAIWCVGV